MRLVRRCFALSLLAFGLAALVSTASFADALSKPLQPIVLTVSGEIAASNADGAALFDMDMLKALPSTTFKTKTIWTEGEKTFKGVSLQSLLAAVGGKGSTIRSVALNDYAVDIPVTDAVEQGPILAYELDGEPMSVRDKGPLWIVYPYDAKSSYRTDEIYSRSIWQLTRIELLK